MARSRAHRRRDARRPRQLPVRSLVLVGVLLVSAPASAAVLSDRTAARPQAATRSAHHGANPRRSQGALKAMIPGGETLLTVSCSSTRACVTAGADETRFGPRSLAEQWNGVKWQFGKARHLVRPASALLSAVSCHDPHDCVAVGAYFSRSGRSAPLTEAWNGSAWRLLATPAPPARHGIGSSLTGISCPSPSVCIAVGSNQTRSGVTTLAERWDGRSWRILRTPDARRARVSVLTAVSCSSGAACTAVGTYSGATHIGFALAERWNGTRWLMQRAADIDSGASNALSGVSCPAARTCVAVGGAQGAGPRGITGATLTEIWNGVSWRLLPSPAPANAVLSALDGASCRSATSCQAVGYYQLASGQDLTLIAAWNGTSWIIERSPTRGTAAELFGVSCPAARDCLAIGGWGAGDDRFTIAEVWNGIYWRVRRLPVS